jgi:polyhydroxyalkanoate synthesis regulator phasin
MARSEVENVMQRLKKLSADGLSSIFSEAMSNDRMRGSLGRAGERFMANKRTFDRNIESVLDFMSLPSKRDVRELKSRLDHLSSQLLNLNIKLDRLLAGEEKPARKRPAARKSPRN